MEPVITPSDSAAGVKPQPLADDKTPGASTGDEPPPRQFADTQADAGGDGETKRTMRPRTARRYSARQRTRL